MFARCLSSCVLLLTVPVVSLAHDRPPRAPNVVTDWAAIVQPAIHNAAAPRSGGTAQLLHTYIMLAVYDAVVAIEGGYRPYVGDIRASRHADVRAAAATAAYLTARAKVAVSQYAYLDDQYAKYLATLPDGRGKADGIEVGARASAALLAARDGDGFDAVVPYFCSQIPVPVGEFDPDSGCPRSAADPQPVDAKVGEIRPFTYRHPEAIRPRGPAPLWSRTYTSDFVETRDFGRADSTVRSAEQTDVAYFWSEHPYVYWNRNLISLAVTQKLDVLDAARFFALVHTAVSDAVIAGFAAKYHFVFWRPRTAIPNAALDGNPATDPDPSWTPLLRVNHPEYPSGHSFWSTALTDAVASFFRTRKVRWTLTASKAAIPQLVKTERTYKDLDTLMDEVVNARIWGGLHWRRSMRDGIRIGHVVARHVSTHFFKPARCEWKYGGCR